jgi:ADP-heptose:LPS heptosyltransferase
LIIFQPFGKGITLNAVQSPTGPVDATGRSFTIDAAAKIIKLIEQKCSVLLMNEFNVDFRSLGCREETFFVENINLRKWFGLLSAADAFVGCDSIGQHVTNVFNKPSYVIFGSTYPENVSYPNNKNFTIFDFYKDKRIYSPIRITVGEHADRQNENAMVVTDDQIAQIANKILQSI